MEYFQHLSLVSKVLLFIMVYMTGVAAANLHAYSISKKVTRLEDYPNIYKTWLSWLYFVL